MLICHCNGQSERAIRACIDEGARTEADIERRCGAGGDCGNCLPMLRMLLMETHDHLDAAAC